MICIQPPPTFTLASGLHYYATNRHHLSAVFRKTYQFLAPRLCLYLREPCQIKFLGYPCSEAKGAVSD